MNNQIRPGRGSYRPVQRTQKLSKRLPLHQLFQCKVTAPPRNTNKVTAPEVDEPELAEMRELLRKQCCYGKIRVILSVSQFGVNWNWPIRERATGLPLDFRNSQQTRNGLAVASSLELVASLTNME